MRIAVEICITSKPRTEVANIEKNLGLGYDKVILTFVNRRVLEQTRQLAQERYPAEVLASVRFSLVNQFATVLREFA